MALFNQALEITLSLEGGYKLHRVKNDRGGITFAGIAYNMHPKWSGWNLLETHNIYDPAIKECVKDFYKKNFWDSIRGASIKDQHVANSIFDCSVNMGVRVASKFAQVVAEVKTDGIIGPVTIKTINSIDPLYFLRPYAIVRISAYSKIVSSNPTQLKFLNGWLRRALTFV